MATHYKHNRENYTFLKSRGSCVLLSSSKWMHEMYSWSKQGLKNDL